jgi:hypothetical protein
VQVDVEQTVLQERRELAGDQVPEQVELDERPKPLSPRQRDLAGEFVNGEAEVLERQERGEAGRQWTHEVVEVEVEVLQGSQGQAGGGPTKSLKLRSRRSRDLKEQSASENRQ